jgi:glycosyltransferase involved in cell wall biosynthesis
MDSPLTIVNIVDNVSNVNFGIWNAAVATAPYLKSNHNIESTLWYPSIKDNPTIDTIKPRSLRSTSMTALKELIKNESYTPENTIVVTHGCWKFPTRWGAQMKKMGFHWIYVPHGMLQPWSLAQKKWKKRIYFQLIEGPLSHKADLIRAVGNPEKINLNKRYANVWLNQNGISSPNVPTTKWEKPARLNYLFLARLHMKKGIIPLVEAWLQSPQFNNSNCHLYIAGPDDGELPSLQAILSRFQDINITYLGAVYGDKKEQLLNKCHIYLLPSHSEGFPTSVLEAMNHQMVAVITDGCNFPEAIEADKVIRTTPDQREIVMTLKKIHHLPIPHLSAFANTSAEWVTSLYSNEIIAKQQAETYFELIGRS